MELVGLNRTLDLGILQSRLNHLALVGLEQKSFFLEIIDISLIHALGINEKELDKNVHRKNQNGGNGSPC
jgi:hypothetical protein